MTVPKCECGSNIYDGTDKCAACGKPPRWKEHLADARGALENAKARDEWRAKKTAKRHKPGGDS